MVTPHQDRTFTDLLIRHLALLRAPIPVALPEAMTNTHILNRCGNLQVDLLQWREEPGFSPQLADHLQQLCSQHDMPALVVQLQIALAIQRAASK